jgi:uncharacterized membrane protein/mono/diheme cytochrome c family protein
MELGSVLAALDVSDFARLGRLHPLVLHVPIGFLLAALVLEVVATREGLTRRALTAFLGLAALATVVAAVSGWVLAHEDGYGGATLARHRQLGIALAAVATAAALLHAARARLGLWPYRVALGFSCALLLPAGHLGSELTHGSDWLRGPRTHVEPPTTAAREQETEDELVIREPGAVPAADPAEPDAWGELVGPILERHCAGCHGPAKHKGGLRLDSYANLLVGGDRGPAVLPGDPGASLFLVRAQLPAEHEDHMPPEGKSQPTAEELATLAAWVASLAPLGADAAPLESAPARAEDAEGTPPADSDAHSGSTSVPPPEAPAPPAEALDALARAFVHQERLDPARPELWVDVAAVAPDFGDAEFAALLVPLAPWIAELSLARSAITDASLPALARFPLLARLDLRATDVGDAGLASLAAAPALVRLNLAETQVGDASLELLLGLRGLRAVSLWGSLVTPAGLAQLRTQRPELAVEAGDEGPAEVLEAEGELVFTSERALPGAELVPETLRPINAACPVSGSPVNPKYALVHSFDGSARVVGFCCPNCPKEFWADPQRFEAALR